MFDTPNRLLAMIEHRQMPVGMQCFTGNHTLIEVMGRTGFDFVWLDSEHCDINPGRWRTPSAPPMVSGSPRWCGSPNPVMAPPPGAHLRPAPPAWWCRWCDPRSTSPACSTR